MIQLPWLDENGPPVFPPPEQALDDPDGLLAAGGSLNPAWLLAAYRQGIFPWFDERNPILWWSPDPRMILRPGRLHVSRRLARRLRRQDYDIRLDTVFGEVIEACSDPGLRRDQENTWITPAMKQAYSRLHHEGHAHSIEIWQDGALVGGLYGLAIGRAFFGESMFSRVTDASKIAMAWLDRQLNTWGYTLMDCQVESSHLRRMGAVTIDRSAFLRELAETVAGVPAENAWQTPLRCPAAMESGGSGR